MDLWCGEWYASVENMRNGGDYNASTVEDTVTAISIGAGYCHWSMPLLLYLFGGGTIGSVEHSVPAFTDSTPYWEYTGGCFGDGGGISHITSWPSEGGQLVGR